MTEVDGFATEVIEYVARGALFDQEMKKVLEYGHGDEHLIQDKFLHRLIKSKVHS